MTAEPATPQASAKRWFIIISYTVVFWFLLPAALLAFGKFVDTSLKLPALTAAWRGGGAVFITLGLGFVGWSVWSLWRDGGGLPISHLPPTALVSKGPYAQHAHPIYVGFNIAVFGAGLLIGSIGCALGSSLLLWFAWHGYVYFLEEPALRRRFGASYRGYQERL